jgi:hypothetical protein
MTHIKKVSMMRNDKHITNRRRQRELSQTCLSYAECQGEKADRLKQKFPRLSNLHIIWGWIKRLLLAYIVMVLVAAVMNSGIGIFLAIVAGFLLILSLIRLVSRFVITVVYIILLALILGLIIL